MTVEPTIEQKALDAQGVKPADLNPGHVGGGNKVPEEPVNKKPVAEPTAEEKAAKEKSDKEAADKAAADAEAKKKDEKPAVADAADPEVGVTKWVQLNDEAGDAVIGLLQDAGITPLEGNAIFQKAVASGDLQDVDWAALEKKLPAGKFLLAKAGVEKYYEEKYAPIRETVAEAYKIVGGEKNWEVVKDWANKAEAKDPTLKKQVDEIRKGIAQNGWIAQKAVERLKELYEKAPGNKGLGVTKLVEGNTAAAATGDAMDSVSYRKAMNELHNGLKQPDPAKVAALRARRMAGMSAGLK